MKLLEKEMEDLIIKNPHKYLNEPNLQLICRQYCIGNYRFDLLFEDRHKGKLIVELQRGTLDRSHTYKILDYFDEYKKQNPSDFVELMIVANKITRERRDRLKSYGIAFFEIPEAVFLEDPNWVNKKETSDQGRIRQKKHSQQPQNLSGSDSGQEIFNKLIARNSWAEECSKLSVLTTHRREQLNQIFTEINSVEIPFSYFTHERTKNAALSNSQIFPIICAFHVGYFSVENGLVCLKPRYYKIFQNIATSKPAYSNKHILNHNIIQKDGSTILSKIQSIFKEKTSDTLKRKDIIDMVLEVYPGTNPASVIPSDYCYNIVNKWVNSFTTHLFESLGSGYYKCLGIHYPYTGEIFWKGQQVGVWKQGKPSFTNDPRK